MPTTPASSFASLTAEASGSSRAFIFPPGMIHDSGRPELETRSTSPSFSSKALTQTQAARSQ
uniref:Uncharacterized protein n=1 Tax=Lepeophtheirus salmonis TaxID=72036 RepID=A0A0K2UVI5_LEPSM